MKNNKARVLTMANAIRQNPYHHVRWYKEAMWFYGPQPNHPADTLCCGDATYADKYNDLIKYVGDINSAKIVKIFIIGYHCYTNDVYLDDDGYENIQYGVWSKTAVCCNALRNKHWRKANIIKLIRSYYTKNITPYESDAEMFLRVKRY